MKRVLQKRPMTQSCVRLFVECGHLISIYVYIRMSKETCHLINDLQKKSMTQSCVARRVSASGQYIYKDVNTDIHFRKESCQKDLEHSRAQKTYNTAVCRVAHRMSVFLSHNTAQHQIYPDTLNMNQNEYDYSCCAPRWQREVGGWGRDPKKCTGRDWGMGSSTI